METTQVQQLKLNVTNINSFLKKSNKKYIDLKKSNSAIISQEVKQRKVKAKESKVEKKISPKTSPLTAVKKIASPGMSLFDRIVNFGSILATGVLVSAIPGFKKKIDEFKKDNKEVIDNVVSTLTIVKNFGEDVANWLTEPEADHGFLSSIATIDPHTNKITGGVLKDVENTFDGFGQLINKIDKAMGGKGTAGNALLRDRSDEIAGINVSKSNLKAQTETKSGMATFREDSAQNAALQEKVKARMQREKEQARNPGAASAPDLKTAIRRAESGNDYGATFRAYLDGFSRRNEDITNMSINQVVQYQNDYIAHQRRLGIPEKRRSAAVGAYQMLYPELAASETGVPLTAKFNKENQDRMADYYLNVAGYQQFIQGKITAAQFNNKLAVQFASLKTTSGSGVYDNDGINRGYENLLDLIRKSKPQLQSKITPNTKNKDKQASVLNTTMGEEGSTTLVLMRQPILT